MTEADRLDDSISSFEKALNSWAIIDLPSLQRQLDSNGLEIQSNQKSSISSRKELASLTKHFKKLEQEEKLSQINKLLKNYQNEIDSLTKKNKLIENTFFSVYRAIAEAPDPKPLLTLSLDALNSLKELENLKLQNDKLEEKLLNFADYDQLKLKLSKTEIESKQLADARVRAKEDEFKSLLEEKELNWYKKEQDTNNSVNKLKKQIEEMKVNEEMMKLRLKKSRHFNNDDAGDEDQFKDDDDIKETIKDDDVKDKTISSMEFELLSRDLDTYKLRTMDLEKRNEELRRELSLTKSEAEMDKVKETNNKRILDLESENALLTAKLERERNILDNLKLQDKKKSESLTREINQLNLEVNNLKDIKAKTLDYDDVKKELEILKQIEFGFGDDINLDDTNDKDNSQIIDSAIVQRNKKLNNEVIEFRSKNEELTTKTKELELRLKDSFKQVEILQEMNNKLESDLLNVENGAVNADKWETMSMISSIAPSTYTSKKSLSPAASIAGGAAPSISGSVMAADSGVIQDSSILPIITQQRDRFRVKNKELEEEGKKQFSKIVELKREMNNLKTDNRELYERIRFLQYHKDQAVKAAAASSSNANSFTTDIEKKYNDSYENELHPIEQFRLMETKRINSKISPFERIFIQAVNVVLSTKATRLLFVGYCFMLHLLVMIMTITMISSSTTTTASAAAVVSTKLSGTTGGVAQGVPGGPH